MNIQKNCFPEIVKVYNKFDLLSKEKRLNYNKKFSFIKNDFNSIFISSLKGENLDELLYFIEKKTHSNLIILNIILKNTIIWCYRLNSIRKTKVLKFS